VRANRRRLAVSVLVAISTVMAAVGSTAAVAAGRSASGSGVTWFRLPTPNARPYRIAPGLDGDLWFTESQANQIGRITRDGVITEFPLPFADTAPREIAVGPDGAMWFTQYTGDLIGRIDAGGSVVEYRVPDGFALSSGIAAAPDGNLWFTESNENSQLGILFLPLGYTEEIPLPVNTDPMFIAAGPDGAMWFTAEGSSQIGRVDISTRAVSYYDIPTANALPWDITAGPDGAMWFTELGGHQVGRITMDGSITEYPVPGTFGGVTGITPAFDGTMWVVQSDLQEIDRMSVDGQVLGRSYPTPVQPNHITVGPDGNVWYTEIGSNAIVRITVPNGAGSASILSYDTGFLDPSAEATLGGRIRWLFRGPTDRTISVPVLGVQIGPQLVGSVASLPARYAGSFAYADSSQPSVAGVFTVPATAPSTATAGIPFTVTWAMAPPPTDVRFDVQVRLPGTPAWVNWVYGATAPSDAYTPGQAGTYSFRARIRNRLSGVHSGWSSPVHVEVSAA
jgi:virginiamycin B lyase